MMTALERAITIAVQAHSGAVDKGGHPYILHPLRVMLSVDTDEERIVAVLHDVLEDSEWTLDQLRREGFSEAVLRALPALTRGKDEEYMDFVRRAGADPLARRVKLADLADNMDLSRLPRPAEKDLARLEKYKAAVSLLRKIN